MTFGIPKEVLPVDGLGNYRPFVNEHFIAKRQEIEKARSEEVTGCIDFPTSRDVLLGRGKPYQDFSGNKVLAKFVESRREEYNKVSRFEKTCISISKASTSGVHGRNSDNVDPRDYHTLANNLWSPSGRNHHSTTGQPCTLEHLLFLTKLVASK